MTVVPILGAGSSMADYRIGFKWWALIIAVVFVISEFVCVACVPERPVACDEKPGKISDMFKALFKNDQAIISSPFQGIGPTALMISDQRRVVVGTAGSLL